MRSLVVRFEPLNQWQKKIIRRFSFRSLPSMEINLISSRGLPFLAQVKVQRLSTCSPDNACGIMSPWPLTQLFGVNASIFPVAIHNMQISYWISIPQNSPLIIMTLIWYCQKPQTSKDLGKQLYIVIANHFIENQTLKMTARFPQNKVNARLHNR